MKVRADTGLGTRDATAREAGVHSEMLAAFVHSTGLTDIPADVRKAAKLLMLDSVGIALASSRHDFARSALQGLAALDPSGQASLIGHSRRHSMRDAAMLNGLFIHGLDYDDTHIEAMVHPTAVSLPAALAFGEFRERSAAEILAAYILGLEVGCRLGLVARGGLNHAGFHATGVLGHFVAALVAWKLADLSAEALAWAQGIAGSTASGIQVFLEDGSWTKRFHAGWAAVAGITAAGLASGAFLGPRRVYEGRFGLFESHLGGHPTKPDYSQFARDLGERWHVLDVAIKPYAICHFIHGCADAAIEHHREVGTAPADIASIKAFLPPKGMDIVAEPHEAKARPGNEYEAKFSTHYVVAQALSKGRFSLAELEQGAIEDEAVRALAQKVTCHPDPNTRFPEFCSGGLEIILHDGRVYRHHVPVNTGAGERRMTADQIIDKFRQSASTAVPPGKADRILNAILAMETIETSELTAALRCE